MYREVRALILLAFILGTAFASVSDAALVGWWKFDDGSGTVARDSSGRGNHGTVTNPDWVTGQYGGALNFTGTNYVDVPAASWSTIERQATVCFWAYGDPAQQPQANFIFGAFSDPANNDARRMSAHVPWSDGTIYFDTGGPGYNRINKAGNASDYEGTWTFWTLLKNADTGDQQIYINGVLWHSGTGMTQTMEGVTKFTIGTKPSLAEGWYRGMIDDFRLYDEALTVDQILDAMSGRGPGLGRAVNPAPGNEATDVLREGPLAWDAGEYAATHDVYFGTVFEDVNDAGRDNPGDVLVSKDQADTTFDPGRLEFGQVYYWRVDEVNAAPDYTIYKGDTWSFTVEPYSYPIPGGSITATASSAQVNMGPQNTVNGSGLSADDQHSTKSEDMWMSAGTLPNWIQYEFDKAYMLDRLLVWNSNQLVEPFIGFGAKDVTIEYSDDGATWTQLDGVTQFAQATGTATYTANTTVDFGGVMARYVKLTIENTWGGVTPTAGLSEVRFFFVPVAAREPDPASGAANVPPQADLAWRAGREAASHQVFLGTDANDLALAATVDEPAYAADLNLDTTYFWKVVEVNEAEAVPEWESDVWSFSTVKALAVDDFESYTDDMDAGGAIFQTWIDGYDDNANGSIVGYGQAPFAERTIVHGGKQSMPVAYDNSNGATYAEAARTFDAPQDWTKHGFLSLSLAFYGDPENTGQMYLKINNTKVPYNGKAEDIKNTRWQAWNIELASTGAGLASVTKLAIGIDGAGAAGKLYFDDIQLHAALPEFVTPVDPGTTNLAALYALDDNANDTSGKGNNGTITGAETWVDGMIGQALRFDGATTYVDCGSGASLNLTDAVTITAWINMEFTAGDRKIAGNQDGTTGGYKMGLFTNNMVEFELRTAANAATSNRNSAGGTILRSGIWYHVAGVYSKGQFIRTYVFGNLDREQVTTAELGTSTGSFKLGREPMSASYYWFGAMDDVRVYNRVLSPEEILWVMGQTEPVAKPF